MIYVRPPPAPIHDNSVYVQDPSIVKSHPTHLKLLSIEVLKDLTIYQTLDVDESIPLEDRNSRILESNERVVAILREVLCELPDQWDALEALVKVTFDSYCRCRLEGDARIGNLRKELREMQASHPENRGPYLAELLLLSIWMEDKLKNGESTPILPQVWEHVDDRSIVEGLVGLDLNSTTVTMSQEMIRLIGQYILRYDTKQCCFPDVKPFLSVVGAHESLNFLHWVQSRCNRIRENLLATVQSPQCDDAKDVPEQLCQISKLLQIEYYLKIVNLQENEEDPWRFVRSLNDLYCVSHEVAGGKGVGGLREVQPGDELLMLASTVAKRQLFTYCGRIKSLPEVDK